MTTVGTHTVRNERPVSPRPSTAAPVSLQGGDWIDVTVPVEEGKVPIYPGNPGVHFSLCQSLARGEGCNVSDLQFGAHTGTHVDAPSHFIPNGATIDQVPLDDLMGRTRVIDCGPDARIINAAELNRHDWKGAERVLFKTRNTYEGYLHDSTFHEDFTPLGPDAAELLAQNGVKLVGIDYGSAEPFGAQHACTHEALLGKGIPIVEGVDLTNVPGGDYNMVCLPARLVGVEAAPARMLLQPLHTTEP